MNLRIEPQPVEQPDTEPLTLHVTKDLLQRLDWARDRLIRKDGQPSERDYTAIKYLEAILPRTPKKTDTKKKSGEAKGDAPKPEVAKKAVA